MLMRVNIERARLESEELALKTRVSVTPRTIIRKRMNSRIKSKNRFTSKNEK